MKRLFIIYIFCAAIVVAFVGCSEYIDNGNELLPDDQTAENVNNNTGGCFRAVFFPQNGDNTRAIVDGESMAIQSLVCLIYQKQDDDSYTYIAEKPVITYNGTPQSYRWPLQEEVVFDNLPNGEYKAVFVGNTDKTLFDGVAGDLLTDYQSDIKDSRLNMPENAQGQPLVFKDYNMFYLCMVDFSDENPSPHVLMQRVVSSNKYGRDMINNAEQVPGLLDSVVDQIKDAQLTSDIVEGLLSGILTSNSGTLGIYQVLIGLLGGADYLTGYLLTPILNALYPILKDVVVTPLNNALLGTGNSSLLGLGYILNPWTTGTTVDVYFSKLPRSMDFERDTKTYYEAVIGENDKPTKESMAMLEESVTVDKDDNLSYVTVRTLCGEIKAERFEISERDFQLLAPLLGGLVDKVLLNDLLIDIDRPLTYTTTSNLEYSTRFQIVDARLNGSKNPNEEDEAYKEAHSDDVLQVHISLRDIVELEEVLGGLGNILNIIPGLGLLLSPLLAVIGGTLDTVINSLLDAVLGLLNVALDGLDIRLPGLDISQIQVGGNWGDYIEVSNGEHIDRTNP